MIQVIRGSGKAWDVFNALKQLAGKNGHKTLAQIEKETNSKEVRI